MAHSGGLRAGRSLINSTSLWDFELQASGFNVSTTIIEMRQHSTGEPKWDKVRRIRLLPAPTPMHFKMAQIFSVAQF
jgi:hypothetical protein